MDETEVALARVRVSAAVADIGQQDFHAAIRDAVNQGLSLREVARAAGLTHGGVDKIVKRAKPRLQEPAMDDGRVDGVLPQPCW